jgi:hypothetical protein
MFRINALLVFSGSKASACFLLMAICFLLGLPFNPKIGGEIFPPKCRLTFNGCGYIPEDIGLHNHSCENVKSCMINTVLSYFVRVRVCGGGAVCFTTLSVTYTT